MMLSEGGQMELAIMSQLYREPIGENELKDQMRSWNWTEILASLTRLMRRALVVDINKDRITHVYKLTRAGEQLVEKMIAMRSTGSSIGA